MKTCLFPFAIFAFFDRYRLAETPNLRPASLFYIIYVFGVTVFVLAPGMKFSSGLFEVFLMGALYGIVT